MNIPDPNASEPKLSGHEVQGEAGPQGEENSEWLPLPSPALPALLQAYRLQEKAARVGFDWPAPDPVLEKIAEELEELRQARLVANSRAREREELGDLLFAVVNLSRLLHIDPEDALRAASLKFRRRFNRMAELSARDGGQLEGSRLEELDAYWEAAKAEEPRDSTPDTPDPGSQP